MRLVFASGRVYPPFSIGPETRYARSGDVSIAYQVLGDGPFDVVFVPPAVSHVELGWDVPATRVLLDGISSFARVIFFDKRGTGMSDRVAGAPSLETRMDDVRAVIDAAGAERAAVIGWSEGVAMSTLFASTYPDRVWALVLYGASARELRAPDYPWGPTEAEALRMIEEERRASELPTFAETVLDTAGDGFFASFDRPARAVRCAKAIVDAVHELGIDVRSGLHTGECELVDGKVSGIAVHTGARVAAHAGPGEVLVSGTVKDLVAGSGLEFEDRGTHELKGIPGEWRLYAAV